MPVTVGPSTITINYDTQFLVSMPDATVDPARKDGFFSRDTRFVSGYRVTINGHAPILLTALNVEHFSARHEFMSPELPIGPLAIGGAIVHTAGTAATSGTLPPGSIGLRLERSLLEGVHEDYDVTSYAGRTVRVVLEVEITSDFADIFDVREDRIVRRGQLQASWRPHSGELRTTYRNADFRRDLVVRVASADSRAQFANGRFVFTFDLQPKERWHACLEWLPVSGRKRPRVLPCHALRHADAGLPVGVLPTVEVATAHPTLPAIWRRAVADLEALRMTQFTVGRNVFVPAAGIPWFVTLFGRDSLIVAMQSISGFPEFAAGALERLAAFQALDDDAEQDKEPGKIPHELRFGELATLGLLPWAPYYGTHDATPLYLIVLSYAYQWSGNRRILERYRANADAALEWLLEYGDRDGDGFQEYASRSTRGLANQGWKDSWDAIQHADGTIPEPPIALCELQGYAFDALLRMAEACELWGEPERAAELRARARRLYDRFNDAFWWESEGTYYLGLDGAKRPIKTVASNAGHCLASGIVPAERASRVVDRLMAPDMWSGWGIRTLSADHPGYSPYGYHTGSVWPHDNATIAGGFRRAGRHVEAQVIAEGIFAAAERFDSGRLPELFAGLPRDPAGFPVQYFGANVPQAWAASAVFRLVAVLCGIHTVGRTRTIYVNPDLPDWLPAITLHNLRAGKGSLTLHLRRSEVTAEDNTTGFRVAPGPVPRPPLPAPDAAELPSPRPGQRRGLARRGPAR